VRKKGETEQTNLLLKKRRKEEKSAINEVEKFC
jgi:hypothetical protein